MLSNQILQSAIDGLKSIMRIDITITDSDGTLAATTERELKKEHISYIPGIIESPPQCQMLMGNWYFKIFEKGVLEYILIMRGGDDEALRCGKITEFHIKTLMNAYRERFDRDNFIKSLLLDNLLLVDIYGHAKKLRMDSNARRVVYHIEVASDADRSAVEILRGIFPDRQRDFVTAVDETGIILVKEIRDSDETEHIAKIIVDTLSTEAMSHVCVAIGTVVSDLKNVSSSFKEARLAQEVGKIFEAEKQIVNYEKLGIGRLIYQLPLPLCRIFINEMLHDFNIEEIDEEMFTTITKFFENDLNVSETSRELFIHRNTLVYRLDKFQKLTRLDLRKFTDAITFKITLMVNRYMQYKEKQLL